MRSIFVIALEAQKVRQTWSRKTSYQHVVNTDCLVVPTREPLTPPSTSRGDPDFLPLLPPAAPAFFSSATGWQLGARRTTRTPHSIKVEHGRTSVYCRRFGASSEGKLFSIRQRLPARGPPKEDNRLQMLRPSGGGVPRRP